MAKIQLARGDYANLPTLSPGELVFTTDLEQLFMGTSAGNLGLGTLDFSFDSSSVSFSLPSDLINGKTINLNLGQNSTTSGVSSYTEGISTTASGEGSHAQNSGTVASGKFSTAAGLNTEASGNNSFSIGERSRANINCMTAIGVAGNLGSGTPNTVSATNDLFIIGNGTIGDGGVIATPSNAFRVNANGNAYAENGIYGTGADYSEMFEWLDGNPTNEDRIGKFVKLNSEKIEYATSSTDDILGVVSAVPMITGNAASEHWHGKYVKDDFGRYSYTTIVDEHGDTIYTRQLSTEFNPELVYTPRAERPEWDAIGLLGLIRVYDDGTCTIGGYCNPTVGGIATTATYGYRVVKRINTNVIEIIFNRKSNVIDGNI